ncbi:disheveled-associated activator of morphogenesis 1 isoform X3 [Octopus sinensis]|nr:disheveled-associated activator of morphogenesis 1 isoform X3 [Octopus sinensis]
MTGKQGFCWCFGGSRPPEITIEFGHTLKPMTLDIPMPTDENELNEKFEKLVEELDLDKPHREALFNLPPEKKWQIYCSKKWDEDNPSTATWSDFYIESLKKLSTVCIQFNDEHEASRSKLVENLKTALRTQPMSFVVRFIELNGLQIILDFLSNMDYETAQSSVHTSMIGCIKALMNNSQSRAHVLAHPNSINIIAQSLSSENIKTKIAALEILGAMCLVPGGHRKVLEAMLHYQKYACERARFQSIIYDLDRSTGVYKEEVGLKTAIMSFINAILNYGAGQTQLEFRLHLRYEFLMLGIQPVIDKLRSHENAVLDRHLDFFEMVRNEDERELGKKFESVHIDTRSATNMFELLRKKLALSLAYSSLMSILQHMLLMPYNNSSKCASQWLIIDRVVQQMVLQEKNGKDPDLAPVEINFTHIIRQIACENDIKSFQQKMREIEKANDDLNLKMQKKERECDAKTQEKEELISTVNKMKTKLEKEITNHQETKQNISDMSSLIHELQAQLENECAEKKKLQYMVSTGSLPDDAKMDFSSASLGFKSNSNLITNRTIPLSLPQNVSKNHLNAQNGPSLPPPPPPPPPPVGGPPPPPPPMASKRNPSVESSTTTARKKNTPASSQPLKSFNWSKLPETKLNGSIWTSIDEAKMYKTLDLQDFEKTFSAYQRKGGQFEDEEDKNQNAKLKAKELSVVDGRRAQNCTILLSKLKLTNDELATAILNMDEQEDLPKDMLEQLLKFVPTPEESQLLSEHNHEIDQMARADRFLFEMGKIVHYEQRVKALYFKKKFQERISDCKPKIEGVMEASKEVFRSKKLKKLLEIVLAFGNYMNRGQRGNASGFKLISLNKIIDTKSSINKNVTLLHYLLETFEKKFPEITNLEEDLSHVKIASKVNFIELEKDLAFIRKGLSDIEKELDFLRSHNTDSRDKFISVMTDFITVAAYNFSELEESYAEMKQKYERALKSFCEDPNQQPDEFFSVLDTFLVSFAEAKHDNDKQKLKKVEEEKRAKLEQSKKEKDKQRLLRKQESLSSNCSTDKLTNGVTENNEKGEFDDLISALRTGDVFGEDMAKMKRIRRRATAQTDTSRERIRNIQS